MRLLIVAFTILIACVNAYTAIPSNITVTYDSGAANVNYSSADWRNSVQEINVYTCRSETTCVVVQTPEQSNYSFQLAGQGLYKIEFATTT